MSVNRYEVPIATALTVCALVGLSGQSQRMRAPAAHVVTITPKGETSSEPAIAVNPNNPNQVVGAAGRWAAYSTDSGRTVHADSSSGRERSRGRRRIARL